MALALSVMPVAPDGKKARASNLKVCGWDPTDYAKSPKPWLPSRRFAAKYVPLRRRWHPGGLYTRADGTDTPMTGAQSHDKPQTLGTQMQNVGTQVEEAVQDMGTQAKEAM